MKYLIVPSFYAPKSKKYIVKYGTDRIHAISYNICNFACNYCGFSNVKRTNHYYDYSEIEFKIKMHQLLNQGSGFKFTGGEPTLCPNFINNISYVKEIGGHVLVDTNGSNFVKIKEALEKKYIDVLGISIKGLSAVEAMKTSRRDSNISWENVWRTIQYAGKFPEIDMLITYVVTNSFSERELQTFIDMFKGYKNVIFKFNNLQKNTYNENCGLFPMDSDTLVMMLESIVTKNPELRNRIVCIKDDTAIKDVNQIIQM